MASSDLKTWVSDQLHEVLGYSDSNVADYIVAAAQKSTSPDALKDRICAVADVPAGARATQFYAALHARTTSSRAPAPVARA